MNGQRGHADESPYYKAPFGEFSKRPATDKQLTHLTRLGPVGMSVDFIQPAFTLRIKKIEPGSPAAATGKLKAGQIIETINGQKLHDIDPRIQLGNWITEAEADDGKWVMQVADHPGGKSQQVVVQLEPLGKYSKTWPLDCPKSDRIVRNMAGYLKHPKTTKGFADIGMLFLLSTGDDSDLEYVTQWARSHDGGWSYPWHIGYGGLALCEYYLKTGDQKVLPAIQKMADKLVALENFGGWAGRGSTAALSYGGGGGHLNAAGTLCVAYLCMAKECGADVPEDTLLRVIERFYRYAGRGLVPYGQGRPEKGFTDNGKNGKLAFSMAAAANLTPEGENSIYARARDTSAQFSFYSTSYMLQGHTGGGIGEIWRSAAMGLVNERLPNHYREFMDNRRWHYELSRRYNGSFGIVGGQRYDEEPWGSAYAMTFTVPRKTLRLTGAPRSKYSKPYVLPKRPWGTAEDDEFELITSAVTNGGEMYEIANETFAENTGMPMLRMLKEDLDIATVRRYMHHPDYVIRSAASASIAIHGVGLLKEFLASKDARVRRAAVEGIDRNPKELLTREVFDHLVIMIQDPDESWYVKDGAIELLGKAPKDWIVGQVDLLVSFLTHEEWWFRKGALVALSPVVTDDRCYRKILPAIGKMLRRNYRYNVTGALRWGDLPEYLREAKPEVQELARKSFKEAYLNYVDYEHGLDRVVNTVNPMTRDAIILSIAALPGGYDTIYAIGKEQSPDIDLPFKEVFLKADPKRLSPELKKIVDDAVGGNLIPQYIAKNRKQLLSEAASESRTKDAKSVKMPGLLSLYQKVGVQDYSWNSHGPEFREMKWHYHSFDPAEKWMKPNDRLGRYRDVTFPEGMGKWYEANFDPKAAGWKQGLAPFGAADGKLENFADIMTKRGGCELSFCGCSKPMQTLWKNDVLLIQGDFEFPPFEDGYRYRLIHGGVSHVGSGGGYRLYVNGKLFNEIKQGVDRREGERPIGKVIPKDWWPEFAGGKVKLSAITFKKYHPRTKKYGGNIAIFMQRMKSPPVDEE